MSALVNGGPPVYIINKIMEQANKSAYTPYLYKIICY
jgi:hypothetical protein